MAAVVDQTPTKAEETSSMFSAAQDPPVPPAVDYSSIRMKVMEVPLQITFVSLSSNVR
jgi:hypothetical protein